MDARQPSKRGYIEIIVNNTCITRIEAVALLACEIALPSAVQCHHLALRFAFVAIAMACGSPIPKVKHESQKKNMFMFAHTCWRCANRFGYDSTTEIFIVVHHNHRGSFYNRSIAPLWPIEYAAVKLFPPIRVTHTSHHNWRMMHGSAIINRCWQNRADIRIIQQPHSRNNSIRAVSIQTR